MSIDKDRLGKAGLPLAPHEIDFKGLGNFRSCAPMFEKMQDLPDTLNSIPMYKTTTGVIDRCEQEGVGSLPEKAAFSNERW
jgi:hypothetical protein